MSDMRYCSQGHVASVKLRSRNFWRPRRVILPSVVPGIDTLTIRDGVLLPTPVAHDDLAGSEAWVFRLDRSTHRPAYHDLADLDRLGVALGLADPATHVGVYDK